MAGSIGDWFADHTRSLSDDAPDDEVVESQLPWDVRSSGTATARPERRSAGYGGGRIKRRETAVRREQARAAPSEQLSGQSKVPSFHTPLTSSLRQTIVVAIRSNPRADAASLAAFLTRHGTPVRAAQIKAVKDELSSPFKVVPATPSRENRTPALQALSAVQEVVRSHPGMSKKALLALLRARGITATKAEVAAALSQASAPRRGPQSQVTKRRNSGSQAQLQRAAGTTSKRSRPIRISAGAQTSRTTHETPLCSSCGMRVSINSSCRCS